MYSPISIGCSEKQMSRLRNGHRVRIMKGEGVNLLVDPSKFNSITKAFSKGKGAMVQLSPEELAANRGIEGEGIFGKKFDRLLKKGGIKKTVFQIAEAAKPVVKEAMKVGLTAVPPQYQPAAAAATAMTSAYMDKPTKYQSKKGATELAKIGAIAGAKSAATQQLKGLKKMKGAKMAPSSAPAPVSGQGLYTSRGMGVGARGALLNVGNSSLPPAMQSQNASANFNMWTQLPPALASMKISGSGLYM